MYRFTLVVLLLVSGLRLTAQAQSSRLPSTWRSDTLDFRVRVKQMSEFFNRFNHTDEAFKTLFADVTGDTLERPVTLKLLMGGTVKREDALHFIADVSALSDSTTLHLFDNDWYAEVQANARLNDVMYPLTLVLKVEPNSQRDASRWVLVGAQVGFFDFGKRDSTRIINPASHETRFISLYRAFEDKDHLLNYTARDFRPNHLSLLLYAAQQGILSYEGANAITFHFLQIDGWIFRVSPRNTRPQDWAIVALEHVTPEQKEMYRSQLLFR